MEKGRINSTTIGLMVSTALFFDALQTAIQLIPFAGQVFSSILSVVIFMTFWLWFKLKGVNFGTARRAASMTAGFLIELIPIINILPAWTLAVGLVCADTKVKDIKDSKIVSILDYKKKKAEEQTNTEDAQQKAA